MSELLNNFSCRVVILQTLATTGECKLTKHAHGRIQAAIFAGKFVVCTALLMLLQEQINLINVEQSEDLGEHIVQRISGSSIVYCM